MIGKTISRLVAVQTCYQFAIALSEGNSDSLSLEKFIFDIVEYYKLEDDHANQEFSNLDQSNISNKLSKNFIFNLSESVFENLEEIDNIISSQLEKEESIGKMNLLLKTIIRCATAEILFHKTPEKVVIDEYVSLARDFFSSSEVNFTNAILDKISKQKDARI